MKLKQVTAVTIGGLSLNLVIRLCQIPWHRFADRLSLTLSLVSMALFHGSLLFFLTHLYRKS